MIIFLNGLHNISYIFIFIFFKIIVLFNAILDFFGVFAFFFVIRDITPYYFIKLLRLFRSFAGLKIIIYYY